MVKNPPASTGDGRDKGSIPGSGKSLGGGNGTQPHCSCLENFMGKGIWQAAVHVVSKESDMAEHLSTHIV